jgi:uncharacterized membrane protein YeiB
MRLLMVCATLGMLVMASSGSADAAVKRSPESYPVLLTQVSHREVKAAILVPKRKVVLVGLKDGRHYRVKYTPAEKQRLLAALHAKQVHVSFAKPKAKTPTIRRRYIAGAVVGLGLLAAIVLLVSRRRRRTVVRGASDVGQRMGNTTP